jgi:hypothetical protein
MTDPQWQNSTVLSGDPVEEGRALKGRPGKDIVVTGSIMLSHTLIGRAVPTTAIVAETLVKEWMVEIEVIAAA